MVSVVVVVVVVIPLESCDVSSVDVEVEDSKVPGVQRPLTVEGQLVPSASSPYALVANPIIITDNPQ